jgi:hypothetical protein
MLVSTNTIDFSYSSTQTTTVEGNQTLNGEQTYLQQQNGNVVFNIDMVTGLIILIISLVVVGVLAGIRVLGSGLSSYSVQLIHKATVYYGLWSIFSVFSFTAFLIIPNFGIFAWFILTLIYSLGFFKTLDSGGEDD